MSERSLIYPRSFIRIGVHPRSSAAGNGGYTRFVASKKPWSATVGEYTSLAFMLPLSTLIGYGIGYLLDKAFHTHWIYIPGLLFGIAAGLVELVRQLMRDTHDGE